jgi:ABC-2 type transport system permease protein
MPSLAWQTLSTHRRRLALWAGALVGLATMYSSLFPSIRSNSGYTDVVANLPKPLQSLFATSTLSLTTGTGYVDLELLSLMAPLLLLVFAIGYGASTVAGEREAGTLDLLLTCPVSRRRVLLEKLLDLAVAVVALMLALWLAILADSRLFDLGISTGHAAAALLQLGLLGLVFGSLALTVGAATGRPALARVAASLAAVVAYLLNGLAPLVDGAERFRVLSPFYQYIGHDPLRNGSSPGSVAIAVGTVVVLAVVAVYRFDRLDISR